MGKEDSSEDEPCPLRTSRSLFQEPLKPPNKVNERNAKDSADLPQFEQVEAARAGFVIANERLRLAKCTSHVNLTEPCLRPEPAEE